MRLLDRIIGFSDAVEARFPPLDQIVDAGGRKVHAVSQGSEGDVPLVLIHGASGNVRDFTLSIVPDLATRHRVIALDRPGFGHSDPLPGHGWQLSDQVATLRAALHAMGVRRYALVGHSYGGSLIMRWVLEHPDEVAGLLALSAPMLDWGGGGIGAHYKVGGRPIIGDLLARLVPVLAGRDYVQDAIRDVFSPDAVPEIYLPQGGVELALRPPTFRANATMMLRLYPQIVEQAERYDQITCPLHIVHGEADTIVPCQIHAIPLKARMPEAELTLLPGIGHMPHHARPGDVIAAIDRLMAAAA